ncbi:hypothetical protein J4444_04375 [Candidatus Woesearchaeota archaeon]|nr:hypothetical protein [Candidatus Woesearchaeota archaeon]
MTTVKQNVYFPDEVLTDLQSAADQSGRSISWLINRAWQMLENYLLELILWKQLLVTIMLKDLEMGKHFMLLI